MCAVPAACPAARAAARAAGPVASRAAAWAATAAWRTAPMPISPRANARSASTAFLGPREGERSEPLMRSSVSPSHTNDENGERRTSHSEPVRGHEKVPAYSHPAPVARPGAGDRSTVPRPFTGPARQPSATGSARPRENSGTVQPPGLRSRPWPVTPIVARARPSRAKAGNGSRARPDDYR
jgi:hypothetical protein